MGKEHTAAILSEYGFTNFTTLDEYLLGNPVLWPHSPVVKAGLKDGSLTLDPTVTADAVDIVLVVQDPCVRGRVRR